MTKLKKSVQEAPKLDVSKVPLRDDYKYEIEVRVKLSPNFNMVHKGEELYRPPSEDKNAMAQVAGLIKSGHVFFVLRAKDETGKKVCDEQVGFTYVKNTNKTKAVRKIHPLYLEGFVQDQEKENPQYDFAEKYEINKDNFKNVVNFIEEKEKNPPRFLWPVKYNCVKFTKKALNAAGLNSKKIIGLINLPTEVAIRIQTRKKLNEIKKAMGRIKQKAAKNNVISNLVNNKKTR
jgi:hypothetical protein